VNVKWARLAERRTYAFTLGVFFFPLPPPLLVLISLVGLFFLPVVGGGDL